MFKHIDVYKRMQQEAKQNKTKSEAPKITIHFKVTDKKAIGDEATLHSCSSNVHSNQWFAIGSFHQTILPKHVWSNKQDCRSCREY